VNTLRWCLHCGLPYDWHRSTSRWLRLTYCGTLCERADLGFTIDDLLAAERNPLVAYAIREAASSASTGGG